MRLHRIVETTGCGKADKTAILIFVYSQGSFVLIQADQTFTLFFYTVPTIKVYHNPYILQRCNLHKFAKAFLCILYPARMCLAPYMYKAFKIQRKNRRKGGKNGIRTYASVALKNREKTRNQELSHN